MPSTRKQKAKKRFRQSGVKPDLKKNGCFAGKLPRSENEDHRANSDMEVNLESGGLFRETIPIGESFRTSLNTNSSENSGITIETTRKSNMRLLPTIQKK